MSDKICIACEKPMGEPHEEWCPVVTGTLSSLDNRPRCNHPGSVYCNECDPDHIWDRR